MQTDQSIVGYRPKNDYNANMLFRVGLNEKQLSDFIPFRDNWTKEAKEAIEALCTPIYKEPEQADVWGYANVGGESWKVYKHFGGLAFAIESADKNEEEMAKWLCDQLNRPASEPSQVSDEEINAAGSEKWEECNRFHFRSGGVNPTPFDMGFKSGAKWALSKSSPQKEELPKKLISDERGISFGH